MEKIGNSLNNVMKNLMIRCMLNPNNKDLYIGTLTIAKVQSILNTINDDEFTDLFWSAFDIAQATLIKSINHIKYYVHDKPIQARIWKASNCCPECGYQNYQQGANCPNCDYIEY